MDLFKNKNSLETIFFLTLCLSVLVVENNSG